MAFDLNIFPFFGIKQVKQRLEKNFYAGFLNRFDWIQEIKIKFAYQKLESFAVNKCICNHSFFVRS